MLTQQTELAVLIGLASAVVLAGAALVLKVGWRSLLPPQRWRQLPNLGSYCWFLFFLFWIPAPLVARALINTGVPMLETPMMAGLVASSMVFPLQMMLVAWGAHHFLGAVWRMGLPSRMRLWPSVAAGFVTWLAFFPPTQGVNLLIREIVHQWAEGPKISQHPLIQTLLAPHRDASFWILISIESIILAPIREELFFRSGVQPWLIRQQHGGLLGIALALLAGIVMRGDVPGFWNNAGPPIYVIVCGLGLLAMEPSLIGIRNKMGAIGDYLFPAVRAGSQAGRRVYGGVIASSLLFAMFHSSSWPDPIPLTILGLGHGWLAWRTQSVLGPIVCHSLFNAMTIFQLRVMALSGS